MAESDDKLSASYRKLAREEPSAELDAAILAASRRALGRPSFARRWGAPVSIAAVLVLALGVTLRMQQEEPGVELSEPAARIAPPQAPVAQSQPSPEAQPQAKPDMKEKRALPEKRLAKRAVAPVPKPFADAPARVDAPAAPPPTPAPTPAPAPAAAAAPAAPAAAPPPAEVAASRLEDRNVAPERAAKLQSAAPALRAKREMAAGAAADAQTAQAPPSEEERELDRIARLRVEGRHAEADKALEEFRRKYPAYRIPDAVWERVKPR